MLLAILNSVGVVSAWVGVTVLFRFGVPFEIVTPNGMGFVVGSLSNETRLELNKRRVLYKRIGWVALAMVSSGALLQVYSSIFGAFHPSP